MSRVNEKQAEWQRPQIINEPLFTILKIFFSKFLKLIIVKMSRNKFVAVLHFQVCYLEVGIVVRRIRELTWRPTF